MGKKKKELKKQRKHSEKLGIFRGKPILIRESPDGILEKKLVEINDIDFGLINSYLGIIDQKYGKNQTRSVCKSHRDHILVVPPIEDCAIRYIRIPDPDRIWEYMGILREIIESGNLSQSIATYNSSDRTTDYTNIVLEQCPEKPSGYYRLAKNSDTLPGLSRMMNNYIIDEVAAVVRMNSFNYQFDKSASFRGNSSMHMVSAISNYTLSEIKDDPKFYKELDIRTCLLGDIETSMTRSNPVLCFTHERDGMIVYFYKNNEYKGLSPYFGTVVSVVTNPNAFLNYPGAKSEIFGTTW